MKYKYMFISCFTLIILSACTGDFEELNTNNNVPKENTPGTLLPSVIFEPINSHMTVQTWLTDQIMHYYVRRNDNQLDAYDFATGQAFFTEIWKKNYAAIWNANDMITKAEKEELIAYVAAGKIMKAYYLATNTELWINVPASEAGLGEDNITPSYDTQQDIYISILKELKEANTLLTDKASFSRGGDVLFGGDVSRWKKLANSLRLRYLLRVSNKSEINADTEINAIVSDPATYPIITSNDDAGIYKFSGISPNIASFSQQAFTSFSGLSMSERMEKVYEVYGDPRIDFFFRLPTNKKYTNHKGVPNGLTREAAQAWNGNGDTNTSLLTTRFVNDAKVKNYTKLNYTMISHAEVQFILAEAAMEGWITTGTATAYYNAGITANFNQWGITIPAGFLNLPAVVFDDTIDRLMDQKWLAFLFNNTIESWGEQKRTGFPKLTVGALATKVTVGKVPTRVFYPTLEQSINSANYKAAVSAIGKDDILAKHWYQN